MRTPPQPVPHFAARRPARRALLRTAWRLYGSPARLYAALRKAMRVLGHGGPSAVVGAMRRKLRTPQMPTALLEVEATQTPVALSYEERWQLVGHGLSTQHTVSAIILTRGNQALVETCLRSLARSLDPDAAFDVTIVNNGSAFSALNHRGLRVTIRPETRPFNWSAYNNTAAAQSAGEYLLFLNDDVQALHGGWLDAMLAEAVQPGVGVVGAKLLYPHGRIQHIGITMDAGPEGGHPYKFEPRDTPGTLGECLTPRAVDAVTGACLLSPKALWKQAGGFDALFAENYNDVDYCLRLQALGFRTVVTPLAELIHAESATRALRVLPRELSLFRRRWQPARSDVGPEAMEQGPRRF